MVTGILSALALGLNTVVLSLLLAPFALAKALSPPGRVRRRCDAALNAIARRWMAHNNLWLAWAGNARWDVAGLEGLDRRAWYVVVANHQSWTDVLVLQRTLGPRTPLLKFFLKRELIWVPVIGLAWWALDFPFMRRKGGREDLARVRAACERFRTVPTALLSFAEGTRYSGEKARLQKSPYRHLLKPRAGGIAQALATLGERVDGVLDVTIVYPQGVPRFWDLLSGRVREVVVRVRRLPPPSGAIQAWINELWLEKDRAISALGA
jgi:1-acyl-sn-glycerol-3-phosphate acyltransferase